MAGSGAKWSGTWEGFAWGRDNVASGDGWVEEGSCAGDDDGMQVQDAELEELPSRPRGDGPHPPKAAMKSRPLSSSTAENTASRVEICRTKYDCMAPDRAIDRGPFGDPPIWGAVRGAVSPRSAGMMILLLRVY